MNQVHVTHYVFMIQFSTSRPYVGFQRSLIFPGFSDKILCTFRTSSVIVLQRGVVRFLKVHETDVLCSGTGKTFRNTVVSFVMSVRPPVTRSQNVTLRSRDQDYRLV
jgi:hypothetical protein